MSRSPRGEAARLLWITTTHPTPARPHQGSFNHALVSELRKSHPIQVIAPVPWVHYPLGRLRAASTPDTQHPIYIYPPKTLRTHYGSFYSWSIRGAVRRAISVAPPNLVMGYWTHPDGEAALRVARRLGVPFVMMVGGSDVRLLAECGQRRRRISSVLRSADRVIVVSRDLQERVAALGVPPERIELVYRGVDERLFHPGSKLTARCELGVAGDRILLLWAGRMVAVKNPLLLIRAIPELKVACGGRLEVAFLGDGPLITQVKSLASCLSVSDCCRFVGSRNQQEMASWYRAADLTVLTSDSEGVPNVLLESRACGTGFVASDVGGVSEVASGTDRLFPPGNVEALAKAVTATLLPIRDARGEAHRRDATVRWTLSQSAARISQILRDVIQGHRP